MIKFFKYVLLILLALSFNTCKRSTALKVTAFNYALNEPIANANVVIVERKTSGWLSASYSCREVANATTDSNGECLFDEEKLKNREAYDYYAVINNAYGKAQYYPCGGKTSGFLAIGKVNEKQIHSENFEAYIKVQYNNLLNPAQAGDSIAVGVITPEYRVPGEPYAFGGGGIFSNRNYYGDNNFPYSSQFISNSITTIGGKHILKIYKKKMGVVTNTVDTIKIYPYETKLIEINW